MYTSKNFFEGENKLSAQAPINIANTVSSDHISQVDLQKLYDKLIEVIEKTSQNLYRHTIELLKRINPTLDQIAELCEIFITLFEKNGISHENSATEAVVVIREAAVAVSSGDQQTVIDCAYHLEDFISRLRTELK